MSVINVAKFTAVLCAFVCAVAGVVWSAVAAERSTARHAFVKYEAADAMLAAVLARESALRGFAQTRNPSFLESYDEASAALAEAADLARAHADGRNAERLSIAEQERIAERWAGSANDAIIRARNGREISAESNAVRSGLLARFRESNDELRDLVQEQADAAYGAGLRRTVALIVILSAAFAGMAGMLLSRLRRQERERQLADQSYHSTQREFAEILQVTETESEAHALVKRHLERTLPGSDVVVLNRNNSQNRLEATTPVNTASAFAHRLVDSAPNSCLAVRLGRPHEQSSHREPLLACNLCGLDRRSICVPSLVGGEVIGSVLVTHDAELADADRNRISESVSQAAPVLANLRNLAVAEVRAATDALTGLPNARALRDTLMRMLAQAARSELTLAAVLCDLDNFKQINDVYGHMMGDQVLRELGWLLDSQQAPGRGMARASDFSARYGGEEFALILPDTSMDGALSAAERLRHRVTTLTMLPELTVLNRQPFALTCSIGVATFPIHASIPSDLIVAADTALYTAKTAGKNCVRMALPANPSPSVAAPLVGS
jgi:diguanylate cyclase (GGDEF)-like protein